MSKKDGGGERRKPDELTAKRLKSGEETLWFDCCGPRNDRGGVIGHHSGEEHLVITLINDEAPRREVFVVLRRPLVAKLLPYLQRFVDGGDFLDK